METEVKHRDLRGNHVGTTNGLEAYRMSCENLSRSDAEAIGRLLREEPEIDAERLLEAMVTLITSHPIEPRRRPKDETWAEALARASRRGRDRESKVARAAAGAARIRLVGGRRRGGVRARSRRQRSGTTQRRRSRYRSSEDPADHLARSPTRGVAA